MRLAAALALLLLLAWPGAARADGPQWDYTTHFTYQQQTVIAHIYRFSDYHGLRDEDRDLFLRLAYRETGFGVNIRGDYDAFLGRFLSIGVMQWREEGIYLSTPCYREYGWAGRWNTEVDLWCAGWAIKNGYVSHWYPWLRVRWLYTIPPDPRPWLWGGPHPPTETISLATTDR